MPLGVDMAGGWWKQEEWIGYNKLNYGFSRNCACVIPRYHAALEDCYSAFGYISSFPCVQQHEQGTKLSGRLGHLPNRSLAAEKKSSPQRSLELPLLEINHETDFKRLMIGLNRRTATRQVTTLGYRNAQLLEVPQASMYALGSV